MEQLIAHLVGDYILQTDRMASRKRSQWCYAVLHAAVYTLPFIIITQSIIALLVICATHAIIDRFGLARYVVFAKNWIHDRSLTWADCSATGYPSTVPPWLSVWLLIIADNTIHLVINYLAIRYL